MASFGKVQQLNELRKMRSQAMKMKKELEKEEVSIEDGDVRVKVNGAQEVVYIEINGEERDDVKKAINKAMQEVQKKAAQKMMEMGGGLSGLLGK